MLPFKRISIEEAKALIDQGNYNLIDIRDEASYNSSHIETAKLIDNSSVQEFVQEAEQETPLLVCCYHGNSSQSAAAFFSEQGFEDVYSIDGGFEAWRSVYPTSAS